MTVQTMLEEAFEEAFVSEGDTTLTPPAFLKWVQDHRPALVERLGADAVLAFAAEYCRQGIRTLMPGQTHCR